MRLGLIFTMMAILAAAPAVAADLFFEDEPVQQDLRVFDMSATFADIYEKLDGVRWGGRDINVAIESLENLNPHAHIAATDERVVLVWDDAIVANFPRPAAGDWNAFGQITTALVLKMREHDNALRAADAPGVYRAVVDALVRGIDEQGRYIYSRADVASADTRLVTTVGMESSRDARGNWRVHGIYRGAPADVAGIRPGDLITEINGAPAHKMSDAEFAAAMSGFNSGTVKVHISAPNAERDAVLRRATIVLADADVIHRASDADDASGDILEIAIHNISDNAVAIVTEALNKYPNVSGIILDLRTASGDDARAAARLGGLFMGGVPIMRIAETANDETEVVPAGAPVTTAPVVVLVSNTTRTAAEALAAAFYENARGILVGTPTAGAARMASRIDLNDGGALELMNRAIKTGTGRDIDGRGVFPIVCLSNIRSAAQRDVFFVNVLNNNFKATDFNSATDIPVADIRRGCPTITSGTDEDAVAAAVSAKILTDKTVYDTLINM